MSLEKIYIVDLGKDGESIVDNPDDLPELVRQGKAIVIDCDLNEIIESVKTGGHFSAVKIGEAVPCTRTFQINFKP